MTTSAYALPTMPTMPMAESTAPMAPVATMSSREPGSVGLAHELLRDALGMLGGTCMALPVVASMGSLLAGCGLSAISSDTHWAWVAAVLLLQMGEGGASVGSKLVLKEKMLTQDVGHTPPPPGRPCTVPPGLGACREAGLTTQAPLRRLSVQNCGCT